MGRATILTIIPRAIAEGLSSRERINDYNNLPQLNKEVLDVIKEYIANQIGFDSVPIAGLCQRKDPSGKLMIKKDFAEYIPVNARDSILLILEIPDDQIVSIDYSTLLELSASFADANGDKDELEYLKESLMDSLTLGPTTDPNMISFIPFVDYKKCKYFAVFNAKFEADKEFAIPGIDRIPMRELTTFSN